MPEMDGLTLARVIEADGLGRHVNDPIDPIGQAFCSLELKAAGIEPYLVKPINIRVSLIALRMPWIGWPSRQILQKLVP